MNKRTLDRLDYSFNALGKAVSFNISLKKEDILMIVNLVNNIVIYNFADSIEGGTFSGNILTLDHDTISMSNTDELMVIVFDKDSSNNLLKSILSEIKQSNELLYLINEKTE